MKVPEAGSGVLRYLSNRAQTIVLLAFMTMPLFYVLLDSYQVDFHAFYIAAVSASNGLNPYVDNRASGEQFIDPTNQLKSSRWVYPPSALFFVAPFAKLHYPAARLLFGLLSLGSLGWILLYLSGKFQVVDSWLIASSMSLPVLACVERGQIDLLVLFLLVLSYACGRRFWAGIPLGMAISIKIFPAAVLLWLVFERRFREAATTLAVTFTIILLSAWRYGIAGYSEFRHNLASLGPGQAPQKIDLIQQFGGLFVGGRWLALTQGFIGSFNNPLVLLKGSGVAIGAVLIVAIALWLRYKRVSLETGFFTMVLVSQLINTRLWTMGMVMYLPICLLLIGKARSTLWTFFFMLPLFLPAQVRPLGVSPRFTLAIAIVLYAISRGLDSGNQRKTTVQS